MVSKIQFIFATTIFFLFVVNVSGLIGETFVEGFDASFTLNSTGNWVVDSFLFVFNNIATFFTLMGTSSEFFLFGAVVVGAYTLSMFYLVIEVIRGI
jgi:hypothetical protein